VPEGWHVFAQADGDGGAAQAVFISPSKKKLRSDDALAAFLAKNPALAQAGAARVLTAGARVEAEMLDELSGESEWIGGTVAKVNNKVKRRTSPARGRERPLSARCSGGV
jgi:hypothetical protein